MQDQIFRMKVASFMDVSGFWIEGYLAHKKLPPPLEPRKGPRHRPTLKSWEEALSYERGTPVEVPGSRRGVPSF